MKHPIKKLIILIGTLLGTLLFFFFIVFFRMCSCPRSASPSPDYSPNYNNSEISYNVTVYDKSGNQYTTGRFIKTADGAWVRIKKGYDDYEQYTLTESDKEEFTHMTTGKSKIEPLYIK